MNARPTPTRLPPTLVRLTGPAPAGTLVFMHDLGGSVQRLVVIDRDERGIQRRVHEAVRFVPLKSGVA